MKINKYLFSLFLISSLLTSCGPITEEPTSNIETTTIPETNPTTNNSSPTTSNTPTSTPSQTTSTVAPKPIDKNLDHYVANIRNATGFGITQRRNITNNLKKSKNSNSNDNEQVLVISQNTEYEDGEIIIEDGQIKEVTFVKIDTTVYAEEIEGEEEYKARKDHEKSHFGYIEFACYDNFEYSVWLKDEPIYEFIYDNDSDDKNKADGVIKISGLEGNETYTVRYKGYGERTEITQTEIGSIIDKVFVYNDQFTIVQYTSVDHYIGRPNEKTYLNKDRNGVAYYDRADYETESGVMTSFVLDNYTGLVYKIPWNNKISQIIGNVIQFTSVNTFTGEYKYMFVDMYINDNNELIFENICPNETLNPSYALKDKYGYKFVKNDFIDEYDEETKTHYFSEKDTFSYGITEDNRVIRVPKRDSKDGFIEIHTETNDWEKISFNEDTKVDILSGDGWPNKETFILRNHSFFSIEDTTKTFNLDGYKHINFHLRYMTGNGLDVIDIRTKAYIDAYLEKFNIFIYYDGESIYYIKDFFNTIVNYGKSIDLTKNKFADAIELINKCQIIDKKIVVVSISSTIYYDIVVEEIDGEVSVNLYETGTYIPSDSDKFVVFQPLNK